MANDRHKNSADKVLKRHRRLLVKRMTVKVGLSSRNTMQANTIKIKYERIHRLRQIMSTSAIFKQ